MYSQDFDTGLTGLLQGLSFAKGIHFDQERLKLEKEAMELQRERQGVLNEYQRELTGGLKLQNEQNRELLARGREHDSIQQLFESTGIDMTKGFDIASLDDDQNVQFASLVNSNPTLKTMFNEMVGVPEGAEGFFGGVITAPDGSLQARVVMPDARGRRTTALMPISKEDVDYVNARVNQIASRGNFGATDVKALGEFDRMNSANEAAQAAEYARQNQLTSTTQNTTQGQNPLTRVDRQVTVEADTGNPQWGGGRLPDALVLNPDELVGSNASKKQQVAATPAIEKPRGINNGPDLSRFSNTQRTTTESAANMNVQYPNKPTEGITEENSAEYAKSKWDARDAYASPQAESAEPTVPGTNLTQSEYDGFVNRGEEIPFWHIEDEKAQDKAFAEQVTNKGASQDSRIPRASTKKAMEDPVGVATSQTYTPEQKTRAEEITKRGPEVRKYTRVQAGLPMLQAGLWSPTEYKTYVSTGYPNELEAKIATHKATAGAEHAKAFASREQAKKYAVEANKNYAETLKIIQENKTQTLENQTRVEAARLKHVKDLVKIGVLNPNFRVNGRQLADMDPDFREEYIESHANAMMSSLAEAQKTIDHYGLTDKYGKPYNLFAPENANDLSDIIMTLNRINDDDFTGAFEHDLKTNEAIIGFLVNELRAYGYTESESALKTVADIPIVGNDYNPAKYYFAAMVGAVNPLLRALGIRDKPEIQEIVAAGAEMNQNLGVDPNEFMLGFLTTAKKVRQAENRKLGIDEYKQSVLRKNQR